MNARRKRFFVPAIWAALHVGAGLLATKVDARTVPGTSSYAGADETDEDATLVGVLADPEILEPIRPLFPSPADEPPSLVRPEPCGVMTPLMLMFMLLPLGIAATPPRRSPM